MAAKTRTLLLSLAALCLPAFANVPKASLLSEKPRQGVEGIVLASHRGPAAANALIALGLGGCLYDSGRRSRSTGKERDAETGLDYFGARYMSAAQGRFTSPDAPLLDQDPQYPQSWNLYAYVRNNPLIFTDPTGNDCVYVNSGGNGIDSINNQNTSKDCGKTGGYWVDGTVTNARFAHGSLILSGTTDGKDRTSSSYGLGPDPGLLALQRAGQLAGPVADARFIAGFYGASALAGYALYAGGAFAGGELTALNIGEVTAASETSSLTSTAVGSGLRRQIAAHRDKLAEYIKNADAFDNKGILKNASPELRQRIVEGRINHLQQEIKAFEKGLEKLLGGK
jgi:RHS repeat-associated protein